MAGKNMNYFLMDSIPNGRIKCTLANWTGVAYKIPRIKLVDCKNIDYLKQSGVYFLFSKGDGDKPLVYAGQSEIAVVQFEGKDYISLTDMVRNIENGLPLIEKWLRNKNTIEFLGIWEEMYNPNFNSPEFEGIKNEAGLNRFVLSLKQWTKKTNSRGIIAKASRYGGTYAHETI